MVRFLSTLELLATSLILFIRSLAGSIAHQILDLNNYAYFTVVTESCLVNEQENIDGCLKNEICSAIDFNNLDLCRCQ